jgi:ectoine hydroxylase-related dioxygenase (phytanoyl-CoA dioxygenase family)
MKHNNWTMSDALQALGVGGQTLSAEEKVALERDGYVIIPDIIPRKQAAQMAARMEEIADAEGEEAGKDFQVEAGATRLGTLINKDPLFDICFLHPKGLAGVAHIMGDNFGLSSITARAAQPGQGHQALHQDSAAGASANVLWVVSDFTPDNGPTRLIPGSHRFGADPCVALEDPAAPHPQEITLIAPAGTMVVINGYLWHGGTRNNTQQPRHLVSAFWTRRGCYQPEAHRRLTPSSQARLSLAARFVIDHDDAA